MFEEYQELVQLSRLALAGRRQDVQLFIRRVSRRIRKGRPEIADQLDAILAESPTRDSPLRNEAISAVPVDADSRLKLVRPEYPVVLDADPIWTDSALAALDLVVRERSQQQALMREGLSPTRSMLFTGPPGVGKSLAARWLAARLDRPLLTLDLSAVMSSFLGKTGTNVRHVLDYAKNVDCVLFLDELDAVAKRRDDVSEIGELKRLVTVLLQEIDDWPATGLLLAATNHPDLLDPAVWRRFDSIVEFPMPDDEQVAEAVRRFLEPKHAPKHVIRATAFGFRGESFSNIDRDLRRAHREAVLSGMSIDEPIRRIVGWRVKQLPKQERLAVAAALTDAGFSQRQVHEWTGVHRDTIRKLSDGDSKSPRNEG